MTDLFHEVCPTCHGKGYVARSDPAANTEGKSRRDHPDTSRKAALKAMPKTGTQRRRVLELITLYTRSPTLGLTEGITDAEIQLRLQMSGNTERPRRVELVEGGWIAAHPRRRYDKDGYEHIAWIRL